MKSWWSVVWISCAVVWLSVFALQYPLQTTFPIGGDAVRYIARAQEVVHSPSRLLANSNYPGSIAVVATSRLLPVSWPQRFVFLMVGAYIATGLTLGWLLWRQVSWQAAATGIALWALVSTGITRHFEDATLAQLLSLPPLLLFFDQLIARRSFVALSLFIVAGVLHPLSGAFAALVIAPSLVVLLIRWKKLTTVARKTVLIWSVVLPLLGVGVYLWRGRSLVGVAYDHTLDLAHLSQTALAPLLLLAPIGWLLATLKFRDRPLAVTLLLAFVMVAALFSLTHVGGLSPLPHRFDSYAILVVIAGAAIALPWLLRKLFVTSTWQAAFAVIFVCTLGAVSWQANAFVYDFYESPGKNARLHNDEWAAILWLRDNLSEQASVASTTTNRHSEWIPVLSGHEWIQAENVEELTNKAEATHIVFFLNREDVSERLAEVTPLFENDGAVVFARNQVGPQ